MRGKADLDGWFATVHLTFCTTRYFYIFNGRSQNPSTAPAIYALLHIINKSSNRSNDLYTTKLPANHDDYFKPQAPPLLTQILAVPPTNPEVTAVIN